MSKKSILRISLDKPSWNQEDLSRLEDMVSYNVKNQTSFSGWTYRSEIGGVFNKSGDYKKIFSALDSASNRYLPIIYKFKQIEFVKDVVSVVYCPDNTNILLSFREHMEHLGVNFIDRPEESPYFSMDIEKLGKLTDSQIQSVNTFVPIQTEIIFLTASVFRFKGKNAQLFHRTMKKSGSHLES